MQRNASRQKIFSRVTRHVTHVTKYHDSGGFEKGQNDASRTLRSSLRPNGVCVCVCVCRNQSRLAFFQIDFPDWFHRLFFFFLRLVRTGRLVSQVGFCEDFFFLKILRRKTNAQKTNLQIE